MKKPGATTIRTEPAQFKPREPRVSLVFYHRDGAKVYAMPDGGSIVVGRTFPADVVVEDASVSRSHARFSLQNQEIAFEDLGSTNGTWLNGQRVENGTLRAGDELRLGDVAVALHAAKRTQDAELHGLESYESFSEHLEEELTRSKQFGRTLSVLAIKVDGVAEDAFPVRRFAPAVLAAVRAVDRVAMYSPSTLVVLFPETPKAAAREWLANLLPQVQDLRAAVAAFPDGGAASLEELLGQVRDLLARTNAKQPISAAETDDDRQGQTPGNIVVKSPHMRELYELIERVAPSNLPVLVLGETGSGKEVVARAIHDASGRRDHPMRSVNCAAIPASLLEGLLFGHERGAFTGAERTTKGIFEQAHHGTVFLDEVGELSPPAQAALLRVLETKQVVRVGSDREIAVDVRVVAATHRDLETMCEAGGFRWDLFYRLNAITLQVPPLRERVDEIRALVEYFIAEANKSNARSVRGIDERAFELLAQYRWPGNVRELKNVIDRAVVIARGPMLTTADLADRLKRGITQTFAGAHSPSIPAPAMAAPLPLTGEVSIPRELPIGAGAPNAGLGGGMGVGGGSVDDGLDLDEGADYKERLRAHMAKVESDIILEALQKAGGNQTAAAKALQIPLRTLRHKLQALGIKKKYE
ncbi:MAG: sigma 54-interacting transcriptional regulator [Polyangiaceae bacterium]